MCLAIPMRVIAVTGSTARCAVRGEEYEVGLAALLAATVRPGDYIVAQTGFALEKMSEEHALAVWALLDDMADAPSPARRQPQPISTEGQ